MSIRITVSGSGSFKGHDTSIGSYQYTEGSMPHDVFDDSGEVGQLFFTAVDDGNSILLYQDNVTLEDELYGSVTGRVNGFSFTNGFVDVTGTSRLNLINKEGTITSRVTTVPQYLITIFNTASVNTEIIIDPQVENTPIVAPAYEGNLWVLLKEFCSFHQLDVSLIGNAISVRPMRQREISIESVVDEIVNLNEENFVQNFDVAYYNYEQLNNVIAYPFGGWTPDVEVYSVEAGETITFDIPVNAYLESVDQPTVQDTVAKDYSGTNSVYSASGNDGLPVPASFWVAFGGSMSFELTDLGRNIRATLRGPDFPELAPYSIAVSDGATEYSTLRIVGSGVFFDRQTVTIPTGLTSVETPQEFGQEIDNIFIRTREEAIDAGVRARRRYALPRQTFDTTGRSLQRRSYKKYDYLILDDPVFGFLDTNILALLDPDTAVLLYPTFNEYDASLPSPYLFNDFDGTYSTSNFNDFDFSQAKPVGQAFGTIAGSRLRFREAYYRVRTTQVSESQASISAEFDTLFSDFNEVFGVTP